MGEEEIDVPAPWSLVGSGYVVLVKFQRKFIEEKGFIPKTLESSFTGGIGIIMYVDYISSDVGPYQELLFIPGMFSFNNRNYFSITKIYVSTTKSVINGQNNWGIPKEYADFEFVEKNSFDYVRIRKDNHIFAELSFNSYPCSIPCTTTLVPSGLHTLAHHYKEKTYLTTPKARGAISFAKLTGVTIDESFFPDITQGQILCTVKARNFLMMFPEASIL